MTLNQGNIPTNSALLPKVSVVIPVYNGEADLPDLLNCLCNQTYPVERVEYLLVDNGSGDRTAAILQDAVQKFAAKSVPLSPLSENQVQSSYAARNAGIRAAKGDILAFTDADCRPQPNWLQTLIQPFGNTKIGMVAGEILPFPGKTLWEKHADRQDTLSQKHTLAHPFYPYGQTANLAVRRSVLEQVGLFRPYLTTGGDADLCWRMQQQTSWQLSFAEQAIVQHRHRATLQELRSQWRRYGRSNRYLHELHGVDLMRELTLPESLYRLLRWLLKELPGTASKLVRFNPETASAPKPELVDLISTPLNLVCVHARTTGQRQAKLPVQAHQIEWL
jgi:cellulose synthase/poly-beta-1,6-N-acetylglucosamine synthase-like glycosyltransferase